MNNDAKLENITIALAGLFQAVALITQLTQAGKTEQSAFYASVYSITQLEASTIPAIFGGLDGIKLGLEKIINTFSSKKSSDRWQHHYLFSIIYLQKRLSHSPKMLDFLSRRLQQIQKQIDYFSLTHATVIMNFADIYSNIISTLRFRMIILGSQRVLQARENQEKLRTLLLAGIRSATLWRQMGGSRWQLFFSQRKIAKIAERILANINKEGSYL